MCATCADFDAHSIYYNESLARADLASGGYGGEPPPREENAYQPFLSRKVAAGLCVQVLHYMEKEGGGGD